MDCFDVLYPDLQLMVEVDHSAGHAKFREDGLHVGNMNVKYGGKQKIMRDTTMTEGCVGPGEAKMHLNSGKWEHAVRPRCHREDRGSEAAGWCHAKHHVQGG